MYKQPEHIINNYNGRFEIIIIITITCVRLKPEEVRHACTNHYKFSALMLLRSHDNVQAKYTELVVIRARMSDLL